MARDPSFTRYSSREVTLRAYMADAAAGMVDGRSPAPTTVTPFSVTTVSAGRDPSTLPPRALAPMSTTTEPGAIDLSASAVTRTGGRRPGTCAVVITTSCR